MCKCEICKREFEYGDKWSPMLDNDAWKSVLKFYGISEIEKERERISSGLYYIEDITRSERIKDVIFDISESDLLHTYVCYECMEKALGRKIVKEDLIGDVPFNEAFEKEYFKKEKL